MIINRCYISKAFNLKQQTEIPNIIIDRLKDMKEVIVNGNGILDALNLGIMVANVNGKMYRLNFLGNTDQGMLFEQFLLNKNQIEISKRFVLIQ